MHEHHDGRNGRSVGRRVLLCCCDLALCYATLSFPQVELGARDGQFVGLVLAGEAGLPDIPVDFEYAVRRGKAAQMPAATASASAAKARGGSAAPTVESSAAEPSRRGRGTTKRVGVGS